jgi:hypothetical protein
MISTAAVQISRKARKIFSFSMNAQDASRFFARELIIKGRERAIAALNNTTKIW